MKKRRWSLKPPRKAGWYWAYLHESYGSSVLPVYVGYRTDRTKATPPESPLLVYSIMPFRLGDDHWFELDYFGGWKKMKRQRRPPKRLVKQMYRFEHDD